MDRRKTEAPSNSALNAICSSDLWHHCFSYLSYLDMFNVFLVCREFNQVGKSSSFWKEMYNMKFRKGVGDLDVAWSVDEWKLFFQRRLQSNVSCDTRAKRWQKPNGILVFKNLHIERDLMGGSIESICGSEEMLEYSGMNGMIYGWCYFEATVWGMGSIGIVSLLTTEDYGWGSNAHVGRSGISLGYHNDDGNIYWNDGLQFANTLYGPTWGSRSLRTDTLPSIVGCGHNYITQQIFFTLDGQFLGFVPKQLPVGIPYTAAFSLQELGDRVELNFGIQPFRFDLDQFCMSS